MLTCVRGMNAGRSFCLNVVKTYYASTHFFEICERILNIILDLNNSFLNVDFIIMTDNQHELVQHCIDTEEFRTIKISDRYLLFQENVIKHSNNHQLDLGKILKLEHHFLFSFS
jgi:hypothetical protein